MTPTRQLAAIMFTDIKGYTALMQQDEQKAVAARDKHRQIFNAATAKFNGRILQYYGDGTLSIFDSAIDAVHCGIEMQLGFRQEPAIPVRIGIHTGDIFFSHEEIVGDSVNVASRIESLAVPGSVFISGKVFDEIKNQPSIRAVLMKPVQFKNIEKPIEVYAVANEGLIVPAPDVLEGKTEPGSKPGSAEGGRPASGHKGASFIIATKLFIPPVRPKAVHRLRLTDRLNLGLHGKLTLISAPAGFGKSTLVSEWISGCGRPAAWLSLDGRDSDPIRFMTYLIAALQTVEKGFGEGVSGLLQSQQPPAMEQTLSFFLNEAAALPASMVLVLDDYHTIDAQPVHDAMGFLLDHLPPQLHLVIATREDPPLPLSRLRVRGQMTELRIGDLRFTAAETIGFLQEGMGLSLTDEEVGALEARTEGWIAGLQLAALSMQGRTDTAEFIRDFTGGHHFILDYLVEEVLRHQPEAVRQFLIQTAILERLCGPLCDAVTGRDDGREMLEQLERDNLFVVPLDDRRRWYRYHHLFAEVLKAYGEEGQNRQLPERHRRAAEWHMNNGLTAEAVRHALAAGDPPFAAGLIELAWPEMDESFQAATWLEWVRALPDDLVRVRPVLSVAYAWALLNSGLLEAGEDRLRDAERLLDPESGLQSKRVVADEEHFRFLPGSIKTARSYISMAKGDVEQAVIYARKALDLLPDDDHLRRGPAAALLGIAVWATGNLEAAHKSLTEALNNFLLNGNIAFALSGTYFLAGIRITQGKLMEAGKVYERALSLALEQETNVRGVADIFLGMGELAFERGDQENADRQLARSEALGEQAALPDWSCRVRLVKARFEEAAGRPEAADSLLAEAEQLFSRTPIPVERPIPALKAGLWARTGRLDEAEAWARERGLSGHDDLGYLNEFEHLTLARIWIGLYRRDQDDHNLQEASALLERLLRVAGAGNRMGTVMAVLVLQSLVFEAGGHPEKALQTLERALAMAEPEGYTRIFIAEGAPMARLLDQALKKGIKPDFSGRLLAGLELPAVDKKPDLRGGSGNKTLIEPLSERELEILRLIAQGLSNQAISERLFLALSTVKGHNQHIFEKLEVGRRTEAVARARELGLL
ncbi:MAG TPA: LuxR C-terminal-related transcriptional regulator [Flavilitoribacter sp.]|nr:LuxR C-terminal-related transcriptional regulator [Flavilitoribacter sp.]